MFYINKTKQNYSTKIKNILSLKEHKKDEMKLREIRVQTWAGLCHQHCRDAIHLYYVP